jgi:sugar/nucleoside kinase (ribokinase family)
MTFYLYAVGNALVDLEFSVSDAQLGELGIDKARMTLIDSERRLALLHALDDKTPRRTGGGSAGNTTVAMQQLGAQTYYSCRVADDSFGRFYAQDLHEHGVHSNIHTVRSDGHTGTCLVMITPDAERTMSTHLGVSAEFNTSELNAQAVGQSRLYYMEGYLAASPSGLAAALQGRAVAKAAGAQLALTLSDVSMVQFCREGLEAMLGDGLDLLFANEDEIKAWFGSDDVNALLPQAATLARTVCVTLGPQGCVVLAGGEQHRVAAPAVKPIDTNGAGDMFAGAFLYALSTGAALVRAAELATQAASACVAQQGNRMPTPALLAVKAQWQVQA